MTAVSVPTPRGSIGFRINELIIVAGPPSSGKTTLLARIHDGEVPGLCEQLGLGDPDAWTHVAATDLGRVQYPVVDRMIIHYDMLAQRTPDGFRHVHALLDGAGKSVILTLMADSESLWRRNRTRLIDAALAALRHPTELRQRLRRVRRLWRRHRVFRSETRVRALYKEWFALTSRYPVSAHWLFDSSVTGTMTAESFDSNRMLLEIKRT